MAEDKFHHDVANAADCPHCGSPRYYMCVDGAGNPMLVTHASRQALAPKAGEAEVRRTVREGKEQQWM